MYPVSAEIGDTPYINPASALAGNRVHLCALMREIEEESVSGASRHILVS